MARQKRHIVHLSSAEIWRGAEQQIIYLYQGLEKEGHQQIIYCNVKGQLASYCEKHAIQHATFTKKNGLLYDLVKKLVLYHKTNKIDVIHIHDPHAHHAYILAYYLGVRVPAILHRRVDFPTAQSFFSKWKYQFKGIQKIVCVSEGVKNTFKHAPMIYNKCTVIYDAIDIDKFNQENGRSILEKDLPQLKDKIIIANIAALVDHKDHFTFIKTAQLLLHSSAVENLHFIIIGQGEKYQEISDYIINNQLQNYITLIGHRKDMSDILNGIDIYVFTSKMEGFGSTILEVMSAKVPIVATKVGGPAEILTHQENALLADIGDSHTLAQHIEYIIHNPDEKDKYVQQAFQLVQKFEIDFYIANIEAIHTSLVD